MIEWPVLNLATLPSARPGESENQSSIGVVLLQLLGGDLLRTTSAGSGRFWGEIWGQLDWLRSVGCETGCRAESVQPFSSPYHSMFDSERNHIWIVNLKFWSADKQILVNSSLGQKQQ